MMQRKKRLTMKKKDKRIKPERKRLQESKQNITINLKKELITKVM